MSAWDRDPASGAKRDLRLFIAEHLGWPDLRWDTRPAERKFNVWMFCDADRANQQATTRDVTLRYPLPPVS
jgi:hypothetical protein